MDAATSVPQPPDSSPLDPDLRDLLSTASSFTHALTESGAFDNLTEREAERYEATIALIERGDLPSRRIAYLQLLDLVLAEPGRFTGALTALHDRLAAAQFPVSDVVSPRSPQLDTLFVSPGVAHDLHQLAAPPLTRWIDGALYIGSSAEHFERVHQITYDQSHGCAWLTTADETDRRVGFTARGVAEGGGLASAVLLTTHVVYPFAQNRAGVVFNGGRVIRRRWLLPSIDQLIVSLMRKPGRSRLRY